MSGNRFQRRHQIMAAALASLALHVLLLVEVEHLPLMSLDLPPVERFTPIEMIDVQTELPPPEQTLDEPSTEEAASALAGLRPDGEALGEIAPPQPNLDTPKSPIVPLVPPNQSVALTESIVRQEALAIPEQTFSEDISALPRRWIDDSIPRVEQAPDIRLPVDMSDELTTESSFVAADAVSWREGVTVGTPEWMPVMGGRDGTGVEAEALPATPKSVIEADDVIGESREDITGLKAMDEMLQVRVQGYRAGDGHLYFALEIERASEKTLPVLPRDILFVQDSSESMTPAKLVECRRGLKRWLDFMNPGDRFDVMGFSDTVTPCFGAWRTYDAPSRAEAMQFIDAMRAVGNTDVFGSLASALAVPEDDPTRARLIVLVTDGRPTVGMTDSSKIIEAITRENAGRISFFSVGGGKQVNSFFLDLLSYRNRGDARVVKGDEEIPRGMEEWARQLRRPVLTDVSYSFSRVDPTDVYPKQLTHLYLDRPLVIYGRVPDGQGPLVFQVVGRSGADYHDVVFSIAPEDITPGSEALRRQWAWQKIYHMIGDYLGNSSPERLESIRAFSDEHGLVVPYGFSRALPR